MNSRCRKGKHSCLSWEKEKESMRETSLNASSFNENIIIILLVQARWPLRADSASFYSTPITVFFFAIQIFCFIYRHASCSILQLPSHFSVPHALEETVEVQVGLVYTFSVFSKLFIMHPGAPIISMFHFRSSSGAV